MHSEGKLQFKIQGWGLFKHYWKQWSCLSSARPWWLNCSPQGVQGAGVRPYWHRRGGVLQWHETAPPSLCGSQDTEDETFMVVLHTHCVYTCGMCAGEGKGQRWCKKLYYCLLLLALLNRSTSPPSQTTQYTDMYKMYLPAHTNANTLPIRASKQLAMAWRRSDSLQRSGPWA